MLFSKPTKDIPPPPLSHNTMEFNEINELINMERDSYQRDLARGNIYTISHNIKQDKAKIMAEKAERAAMLRAKKCTHDVELAMIRLNDALKEHAIYMKRAMIVSM